MVLVLGHTLRTSAIRVWSARDCCRGLLCHLEDFPINLMWAGKLGPFKDKGKFGSEGVYSFL